jgi:hypothetical protein
MGARPVWNTQIKIPTLSRRTREGWGTQFLMQQNVGDVMSGGFRITLISPRGARAPRL